MALSPFDAHLYRDVFAQELHTVLFHVLSGTVGHVLVEAPQQDGPYHDGNIQAQPCQEAAALQGHVRRPDHQGLPGTVRQREEIVTGGKTNRHTGDQTGWGLFRKQSLQCLFVSRHYMPFCCDIALLTWTSMFCKEQKKKHNTIGHGSIHSALAGCHMSNKQSLATRLGGTKWAAWDHSWVVKTAA